MKKSINILTYILLAFCLTTLGCKDGENGPRFEKLNSDISRMTNNPTGSDSTSISIKSILNIASMDGFKSEKFEYYTDSTATKGLVLVRIPELSTVHRDERKVFISLIDNLISDERWEGKKKYIGVFGRSRLMLCKTPTVNKNEGNLSKAPLLDYYE